MDKKTADELKCWADKANYLEALPYMSAENILSDVASLDRFQSKMEQLISDFAMDHVQDLLDDEHLCIIRTYWFSKGVSDHFICLNPAGQILAISPGLPNDLLMMVMATVLTSDVFSIRSPGNKS